MARPVLLVLAVLAWVGSARASEPADPRHRLNVALGYHDVVPFDDPVVSEATVGLEYRPGVDWRGIRPQLGGLATTGGSVYGYGGLAYEVGASGRPFLFAVTTNMGAWHQGNGKRLGHVLEFRSGFEFNYVAANGTRIGAAFHHLSNAGIGRRNPGTEILTLVASFPLPRDPVAP